MTCLHIHGMPPHPWQGSDMKNTTTRCVKPPGNTAMDTWEEACQEPAAGNKGEPRADPTATSQVWAPGWAEFWTGCRWGCGWWGGSSSGPTAAVVQHIIPQADSITWPPCKTLQQLPGKSTNVSLDWSSSWICCLVRHHIPQIPTYGCFRSLEVSLT